jgi:predicted secreted Zn-dependent protease
VRDAWNEIKRLGPPDNNGERFPAAADHKVELRNIRIDALATRTGGGGSPSFSAEASITQGGLEYGFAFVFPRWRNVDNLSRRVRGEWERFIGCLWVHERGHKPVAIPIIQQYQTQYENLRGQGAGGSSSAAETDALNDLQAQLQPLMDRLTAALDQVSASYDTSTRHGATQGAELNMNIR